MNWRYLMILVLVTGCTTNEKLQEINSGCVLKVEYKGTGKVKLACNHDLLKDEETKTEGTITGPSIK